jgi:hypothetical protein
MMRDSISFYVLLCIFKAPTTTAYCFVIRNVIVKTKEEEALIFQRSYADKWYDTAGKTQGALAEHI